MKKKSLVIRYEGELSAIQILVETFHSEYHNKFLLLDLAIFYLMFIKRFGCENNRVSLPSGLMCERTTPMPKDDASVARTNFIFSLK